MQKTGQINRIEPTLPDGYQSKNGYIFTYNMTIQTATGQITGEIGSKSEPYPMSAGAEIIVEVKDTAHGTKFKKVNPQQGSQQPAQGGSQQRQSNKKDPDWDAIAMGKCRSLVVQAAVTSLQMECKTFDQADALVKYMMSGQVQQVSANRTDQQTFEQQYDIPPEDEY